MIEQYYTAGFRLFRKAKEGGKEDLHQAKEWFECMQTAEDSVKILLLKIKKQMETDGIVSIMD